MRFFPADKIIVQNGSGDFGLVIHDYSHATQFPNQFNVIDEANKASDRFYLVDGAVNIGAYEYNLKEQNGDWYLVKTQELNDSSYIAKNAFLSLRSVFETHITSINRQLQSIRTQNKHNNGLWIRSFGRKAKDKFKDDRSPLLKQVEHEELVTSLIYKLMDLAIEDKDYRTQEMLRWFVSEQAEEEEHSHELLDKYDRYGKDLTALMHLDKELAQRK